MEKSCYLHGNLVKSEMSMALKNHRKYKSNCPKSSGWPIRRTTSLMAHITASSAYSFQNVWKTARTRDGLDAFTSLLQFLRTNHKDLATTNTTFSNRSFLVPRTPISDPNECAAEFLKLHSPVQPITQTAGLIRTRRLIHIADVQIFFVAFQEQRHRPG